MANPKTTKEKLLEKYGVTGKYAKKHINDSSKDSSKASSNDKGKQKSSVSQASNGKVVKTDNKSSKEKLLEKYGVTGKYAVKNISDSSKNSFKTSSNDKLSGLLKLGVDVATDSYHRNTTFEGQSNNAYSQAEKKATGSTTISSNLTKEEREKRQTEIRGELAELEKAHSGLQRAAMYGNVSEAIAKNEAKQAELREEYKTLERVGTYTTSEMTQFQIDDLKAQQNKLPTYQPKRMTSYEYEEAAKAAPKRAELDKQIDALVHEKKLYDNILEFANVSNSDDFTGQWRANYRSNELSREADKAMSEYLKNPTEKNKQIAYAYDVLVREYMKNNEDALDDEGAVLPWFSRYLAGYLPQFKDQIIPEAIGGGVGALVGSYLGSPNGGAAVGAALATYPQNYDVIRGSVFRTLLSEGVDEETARQAAEDEALISSLIESGETAVSWLLAGSGKAWGAIKGAAKASVAKGSTNAATKFIAGLATKSTAKTATKAATGVAKKSLWKTGANIVGDLGKQGASEYVEEFLQQGVSIANRDRVLNNRADDSLILGTGNVIKDALTGNNPEALSEMHEAGKTGFAIGVMMGGSRTTVNNIITHYANAKTVKAQNEFVDALINDDESLDALVEKGKASGEGSVSSKIATEVEEARAEGNVTREQVKKLIAANEVYIKEEERITKATGLKTTTEVSKPSSTPLHERLDALAQNNEPIAVEDVKKASGFGENGAKLLTEVASQDGMTFPKAIEAMKVAYFSGYAGEDITFNNDLQNRAKLAGISDRLVDNTIALENAKKATVYAGTFTENEHTKNWSESTKKMVSTVAKHFGMDISAVDKIIASVVDGKTYEANAEHQDGKMRISSTAEKFIHALVLHESGHRMEQFATAEWNELANYLYKRAEGLGRRAKLGFSRGMRFDDVKAEHDNAGLSRSTRDYINEIAVRELETIFSSAEEFNNFIAEIESNPQAKSGFQKIMDFIAELIEEIKRVFAGMSKEERADARESIRELEHIKELYAKAYLATEKAVAEKRAETKKSDSKAETEAKGSQREINYSIREEYAKEIEAWVKSGMPSGETFILGTTGDVLQGLGAIESDIYLLGDKITDILNTHPEMTIDEIKKIPQILENPILILKSKNVGREESSNTRLVIFGNVKAQDGRPILTALDLRPNENHFVVNDMQKVTSAYTKDTNPVGFVRNSLVVYADKKRTTKLLRTIGFKAPIELQQSGFIGNISYNGQNVNISGESFSNVFKEVAKSVKRNFSLKDSDYLKAVESGDMETAQKMVDEAAEKAFSNSKVRGNDGKLKMVYHGRVSDFNIFDRSFANIEGDFGKGYYFTSNEYDVEANYANEEGPDLKNKVARMAERLEWEDEYSDLSYEEREEIAKQKLITSEPSTITAYLNMENPVYINPNENGTFLDFEEEYDEEYDEYGEPQGLLIDFVEALNRIASDYAYNDVDFSFLYEYAYDNGGVHASDAVKTIKHRITDELTDDNGDLAVNEVIRLAFEEIGFDGIIDSSVYYKFNRMDGMDSGTTHYIVFNSNQIKSADAVTYDDKGNVIPLSERFNKENDDIRYSLKIEDAINQSMTMEQAKDMIQRAFVIGEIKEWFDGEYKNGDEWLRGEGADAVAMVVENEWTLQQKFLDKIQGLIDEEYYVADIIEAYEKGTLTGKVKQNVVKRLDTTKPTNAKDTRVFAPKDIQNAQEIYKVALERVTNSNREKVHQARADIIMFAHNRGAAETLGLTQSELNKKLSTWASYTARAKEVSMRINKDVALFNKWTGIENSNVLNRATVSQAELDNLVNDIKGDSNGWQRSYIMRTMLALDTHIDYSELNFEFVGTPKTTFRKSVNGLYDNSNRKITVKYNAPHTVSHEMGHFLDYQWARDLGCSGALTDGFGRDKADGDVKQFLTNFDEFIEQIENSADLRSEYTMDRKEVFARFVAKFVQWVDLVANGKRSYPQEYLSYNDKFTTSQYVEFVRLLQEKSMLDSKDFGNKNVSLKDSGKNDVPGINYSLKGTNNTDTKSRKELLDIIEHLKGEFEVTKFAKADPKKLTKLTKDLLKEYNSKADLDETRSAIDELYTYMANGENGHTAVWEDVYNRAYTVAQNIVENSLVVDDFYYQQYKSLRDYLRGTPIKFDARHDSVPSSYENFNDFRKSNMGRLKFTKDGMSIDYIYQELATLYPEFFDAEEQITSEDQFEQIINVLDQIQPTEINPFDSQIEQVSMQLANDITSRFFDLPQAKPTFADKAERRVVAERIKSGKKVEAVRQQKDARIQKLMESQKAKTKKQLDKLREQRNAKLKKERDKRRDAISKMSEKQKVKVLRARIMRHTSDLSKKLVNPTDNQHIPYEMQGIVAKLLESINLESNYTYDAESGSYKKNDEGLPTKRTQAFNDLKKIYGEMSSSVVVDPDLVGENGWLSEVISLADKRIADMNSKELDAVWQAIRAIEASVSTANKIFSQGKFGTILEYAEALRVDNAGKKERVEFRGVLGWGKKLTTLDMLTPETYFHYLGSAGDSIFRMMRDAQDKHISIMKEVTDFTHKTLKGVDVNSLEKKVHTVKLGGEDVKLTTAQLMELYVLMRREQAREHILIGGILPDVTKGKGLKLNTKAEPIRNLTIEEVAKALSKLTVEEKNIADKLQNFVSTVLSEYGNEASMKVYNYEKFLEKNYWTIRTNKQEIASEVGKDTSVTSVANKGMAKGTVPHANTSVRLGSIFDTFASHSSDMATYAAWLGTSEDINRIRNFVFWEEGTRTGTVKGILDTVHGIHGSEYLQKLLTDIAIGVRDTDKSVSVDKLIGNYKAASVGANLRVVIQQPTAILRATDMISAHYLAEGAVRPLKGWEKAKKYAPIAQWKDWGHFDINTGRQMKDVLFDNASRLEKAKQIGMWGASMADSLAWGQLWNAVEFETKAKHKDLEVGSEEYYETVAKRFTEIVDHTQVVDGILQRSQIMRDAGTFKKIVTSFMGEPTKQYNMALSALYDAKNSKGDARKKAVGRLGRTALTLVTAGIINACAQSIVDALRDDDKEKDYWEKWLAAFVGYGEDDKFIDSNLANTFNPLSYVPYLKDTLSITQGYDVKRMDTESITKTVNAITNMYKAITGTGKYTVAEASAQLFAEVARLYGLPVANVKRDVKSITTTVAIESNSYVLQYRMEKAMLNLNFAGNSKNFMDILFNAYNNDREAYEYIYKDMLESGYSADKIESGMEERMKKAEGVEKSSELTKRYMKPENESVYDRALTKVKSSDVWKSANASQRKEAEAALYDFVTSTSETWEKTRAEAKALGVDETEYTLYQLAVEMADEPKGQEGNGRYSYAEKADAINSLNLGDREIAYFVGKGASESVKEEVNEALELGIDMEEYINFKAFVSETKADKNAKGNTIPNSKKNKVVNYMNNANLTDEEWDYFYYEVMNYKK